MTKLDLKSTTTGNDLFKLAQEMNLDLPEKNIMFMEAFESDLKKKALKPGLYIILDQHQDEEGDFCWDHWIAVRYFGKSVTQKKKALDRNLDGVEFLWFNSFGLPPTKKIMKELEKRKISLSFNAKVIQHPKEGHCGQFCLVALCHMENGTYIPWMKSFKCNYSKTFHDLIGKRRSSSS